MPPASAKSSLIVMFPVKEYQNNAPLDAVVGLAGSHWAYSQPIFGLSSQRSLRLIDACFYFVPQPLKWRMSI